MSKQLHVRSALIVWAILLMNYPPVFAQGEPAVVQSIKQSTTISGISFINWSYDLNENTNAFALRRGYLTIKSSLGDGYSVRFTQDITLDKEGGDAGNIEMRLKYLYFAIDGRKLGLFPNSHLEMGMVHRPWLDYEQNVNPYRVQGTMFLERHEIINTADFGISYLGLLGGKIDKEYLERSRSKQKGRYGSYGIALVNGGGYHSAEANKNKVVEGFTSIRPFPGRFPAFQTGYAFAFGKGNIATSPDFSMHVGHITLEGQYGKLLAQYYTGRGGYLGEYADSTGLAYNSEGWSVFGELPVPRTKLALMGRIDQFQVSDGSDASMRFIGGISYRVFRGNLLLVDFERFRQGDTELNTVEVVLQIAFN